VQRAHLLEGDRRPDECGQQTAQRTHLAHADAGLSPLQRQHDQAREVARQRKGEGPPPDARAEVRGRVVVVPLRAGQHRGRAREQRCDHPAQVGRPTQHEVALRLSARQQDVTDELEDERRRDQQHRAVAVQAADGDDRGHQGQQQHVRHRIGQGRRVRLEPGHVQRRRQDERRDDGGHPQRTDGAVQPGARPEARHPDVDQRQEVQRDQRIRREVGEVGGRGERVRGDEREQQVADDGECPHGSDRPPRDALGPHATPRPPAEGRCAERHDVEEHQVVHEELDGGVRHAPHPGGEQGTRSHRPEREHPIGPSGGPAITCHGGTRRRPCHIRNRKRR
jgi:hypothetical protein